MDGNQLRQSLGISKTSKSNKNNPASQVTSVMSVTSVTSVTSVDTEPNVDINAIQCEYIKRSSLKRSEINKAINEGINDREVLLLALETISIMIDDNLFFYRINRDKLLTRN